MEALANAVRMRAVRLGFRMVNVLHSEIKLVAMVLDLVTIFRAAVGQDTVQRNALLIEKRHNAVIEQIRSNNRGLLDIELCERHTAIGVDEGLLVNSSRASPVLASNRPLDSLSPRANRREPFHRAYKIGVLRTQIAGVVGLNLTRRFPFGFLLLKRHDLLLSQNEPLLRRTTPRENSPLDCFLILVTPQALSAASPWIPDHCEARSSAPRQPRRQCRAAKAPAIHGFAPKQGSQPLSRSRLSRHAQERGCA